MERDGRRLDLDRAAADLAAYAEAGLDAFDMADHYGSAEDIAGRFNRLVTNGAVTLKEDHGQRSSPNGARRPRRYRREIARAAVERALSRLQTSSIDLLQFHWWTFQHPGWLDAMRELAKLQGEGLIASSRRHQFRHRSSAHPRRGRDQDRDQPGLASRSSTAARPKTMSAFCLREGHQAARLRHARRRVPHREWLGRPEPRTSDLADWSTMKYKRFVDAIGGWDVLQGILAALGTSRQRMACRSPMSPLAGFSISERSRRLSSARGSASASTETTISGSSLSRSMRAIATDRQRRSRATKRIPGDCGDEYRRPPFLTASGDLSHHLRSVPKVYRAEPLPDRPGRLRARQRQRLGADLRL